MRYSTNDFIADYENNSDQFYGFYDWFCSDAALKNKAKEMVPKLRFLVNMGIIDGDNIYVWFKNNCPVNGSLYDDFRISTLDEAEDYLGGFCPRTGHNGIENKCSVWALKPDYKEWEFKDWKTFKREMISNKTLKDEITEAFKG